VKISPEGGGGPTSFPNAGAWLPSLLFGDQTEEADDDDVLESEDICFCECVSDWQAFQSIFDTHSVVTSPARLREAFPQAC
jgi:hypothetical protein